MANIFLQRVSNVIAWIMFAITSATIVILAAKIVLYTQKESSEMCVNGNCEFITDWDIYNSPTLQSLNAKPDDWVKDKILYHAYPDWVHDWGIKRLGDVTNEGVFLLILAIFTLSIFNYLLVGRLRFIPWKKIQ